MPLVIVVIALIAAGLAGGATWYLMSQSQNSLKANNDKSVAALQKQINDLKKTQTIKPALAKTTTDWHTYKNTDYGFQLTFGDKWKGYTVVKSSSPAYKEAIAEYNVMLPTTDPNFINVSNPYMAFAISVYSDADYQLISKRPSPLATKIIASKDGKSFAYHLPTRSPQDFSQIDVPSVISTFKFN